MDGNFWVFGYGSLMWRPGFAYIDRQPATLFGWHRSMCIFSTIYRGCPDKPGLVLGLDRGGCCRGIAFRVADDMAKDVRQYLYDREMVTEVYTPRFAQARLADGSEVAAYIFTVRKDHEQYAGRLPHAEAAQLIRQGHGKGGSSRDYLAQTVAHMTDLGIRTSDMHKLLAVVDRKDS